MSTTKPISFALFPDVLTNNDLVYSSTSQVGPYVGPASPRLENAGDLVPFTRGQWDQSPSTAHPGPVEMNIKLVNAGGLYGHAEWAWKFIGDSDDQYRGMNDIRYQTVPHDPFSSLSFGSNPTHFFVIYSKAHNKVLAFRKGNADLFHQAERNASITDPEEPYVVSDFPAPGGFAALGYGERQAATACPYAVGWENPDGTLRVMYPYNKPEVEVVHGGSGDWVTFDVWGSSDGGQTWELIVEDVANKYLGGDRKVEAMTADVSGDWVRCCLVVSDVGSTGALGNITMVSADKGATWKVTGQGAPDGRDYYSGISTAANAAVIGCGTADGRFIRARIATAGYTGLPCIVLYESATRDDDWAPIARADLATFVGNGYSSTVGGFNPRGIQGARTDSHVVVLVNAGATVDSGSFSGEFLSGFDGAWSMAIPLNDIDNATNIVPAASTSGWAFEGSWVNLGHRTAWKGGAATNDRFWSGFQNMGMVAQERTNGINSMKWVGDRIMLMTTSRGRSGDTNIANTLCATYCGMWHRRPLRALKSTPVDSLNINGSWLEDPNLGWNYVYSNYWSPPWGKAGAAGAAYATDTKCPDSPYYETIDAGGMGLTDTWTPNEWTLDSGSEAAKYLYLVKRILKTRPQGDVGMISWCMKVYDEGAPTLPTSAAEMEYPIIGARVKAIWDYNPLVGGTYHVTVAATTSEVAVYDVVAGSTLYHMTGQDFTKWTEFRLAFGQALFARKETEPCFVDFGHGRVGEAHKWHNSGLMTVNSTSLVFGATETQEIAFGIGLGGASGSGGAKSKVGYRELITCLGHTNMAQGQLAFDNPLTLRGAVCSAGERAMGQGIVAAWGGGGGFKDDDFTVPIKWQYGTDQLVNPSPATHWRSTSNITQEIIFDSNKAAGDDLKRFHHDGISLVGCNAPEVRVDWAYDNAFTLSSAGVTVDFTQYTATAADWKTDGVQVSVADDEKWEPHELIGMYAQIGQAGVARSFKIRDNTRDTLWLTGQTQVISAYGFSSDAPIVIYGSQSTGLLGAMDTPMSLGKRWMRLTFPMHNTHEGYHRAGSFVAGLTVHFTVPLDWSTNDNEEGNVTVTTGMNGARVAYKGGPARKTFKGTVLGDASRWRDQFRAAVRELSEYSGKPMVLVLDDQDLAGTMLYSRFTSATTMDNVAWKYDTENSKWIKVGDMSMTFEEEV